MSLFVNPMVLRMGLLLFVAATAFLLGLFVIRRLRKKLAAEAESVNYAPLATEGLPVHAYHAVIQQLKQQKHELAAQHLSERRKAKASDSLSSTILSNLSCGVLFLNTSGLVRQANPVARQLLGFAAPAGLHASDILRAATLRPLEDGSSSDRSVEQALAPALTGKGAVRGLLLNYVSRDGENLILEVNASPVLAEDASLMGTSLVLTDKTDIERIRQDQKMQREGSAELAFGVRTSLGSIAENAHQLASISDTPLGRRLAESIAGEAAQLDRTIGRFLGDTRVANAVLSFLIVTTAVRARCELRKDDHMKNTKLIAIGTLLLLSVGVASAQSLGDYARAVRNKEKDKADVVPASRHFDNDNLPTSAGLSVVGPPPEGDAKSTAPAADPAAERQKTADEWNKKIDEQKVKVDSLSHELDIAQREYRLRAAEMYSDPTNRLRNPAQWQSDDAKFKADIDAKQKAADDARQQYDALQEQAHKAGIAPESNDKDSSKGQDQTKNQGQSQGQDQNKDKQ